MRIPICIVILLFPFKLFGQFEIDRFSLLENNVKVLKLSKHEFYKYSFEDNLIIEEDYTMPSFEGKLVRNYYYSEFDKPDSIEILEIYTDTTFRSLEQYTYYENGNLKKVQFGNNLKESIISIDSFQYDALDRIDTVFHFSNKVETIFGTKRIDELKLYSSTKYFYNDKSQKIKEFSLSYSNQDSTLFSYDAQGKLMRKIEFIGRRVVGCKVNEDKFTNITEYTYNPNGLVKKAKSYSLFQYPNGKVKRRNRFTLRRKYEFHDF
jgi:hypothetical protein